MPEQPSESCGETRGASLRDRARASNPKPLVPMLTCILAACMWLGSATADATGLMRVALATALLDLARALLVTSLVAALAVMVLAIGRARREAYRAMDWRVHAPIVLLTAIAALTLGGGLRVREEITRARTEYLSIQSVSPGTRAGPLVTMEATVSTGWSRNAFGPDLLAAYFNTPDRWKARLERVDFMGIGGARCALRDETGLTLILPAASDGGQAPPMLQIGDRIRVIGRFLPLSRGGLPSQHDRVEAMARRASVGTLVVESPALITRLDSSARAHPLRDAFMRMRESLRLRVRDALLVGVPRGGEDAIDAMLVALILGDSEEGYEPIEHSFRAAGLAHILAISGFNLAVLGWVVAAIAGLFIRDERWRAVPVGLAALIALIVMAPAASAIRSSLMAITGACARSFGRDWNGDAMIALAAIIMLLHAPSDASAPGFQLSYACVLALRHLAPVLRARWLAWMPRDDGRSTRSGWLAMGGEFTSRAIASGLSAFLVSTPIALAHFGAMQPLGLVLTFLCTPLSTVTLAIAYPKALIGAIWIPLTWIVGPIVWFFAWLQVAIVEASLGVAGGALEIGVVPLPVAIALLASIIGCVVLPNRPLRLTSWLAALAVVASLVVLRRIEVRPKLEMTTLAVGDGSAYAIQSGSTLVLFDGGSSSFGGVAGSALLPFIARHGGVVDAIVISHPNLDHYSALLDVLRFTDVRTLFVHPTFIAARTRMPAVDVLLRGAEERGTEIRTITAGDTLTFPDMRLWVLWPDARFRTSRENDYSIVTMLVHDCGARVLLSGDIETEPAARLTTRARRGEIDLSCHIAELPHHGSFREAVVEYLAIASPKLVLQSTAERRFANDRFAGSLPGVRLVTCRDGTVRVTADADGSLHISLWDDDARGTTLSGWRPAGVIDLSR
ncbi:MAG: hypothetical protein RIT24_418 [Planctomycetota bacterium]